MALHQRIEAIRVGGRLYSKKPTQPLPLTSDLFGRLARSCRTIADVGAGVGLYTSLAQLAAPSSATVVAFEPNQEKLLLLRENTEQGDGTPSASVIIEAVTVGGPDGSVGSSLSPGSVGPQSASTPIITLDEYAFHRLSTPIELLRVGGEGREGAVLSGAKAVLREQRPTLFVEFAPERLRSCGFEAEEFLDMIFGTYNKVFRVEEEGATIRGCTRGELLLGKGNKNVSLIATSQLGHAMAIEAHSNYRNSFALRAPRPA